ncbi:MAG TPA: response regulator [Ktedonobacterales bacterium]|nr:response regulator [Ktedonobacterales bacterium]
MRRPTTNEVVTKPGWAEPVAVTESDSTPDCEVYRPVIFSGPPRIALLIVMPKDAVPPGLPLRLDASGYAVQMACKGCTAMELAEQTPPDIILLDLDGIYEINQAGKVSGFRVLQLLGRLRRGHPMAVVVMTSMDYTEVEGPVRASADDFVKKPIDAAHLIHRLQGALDRVRSRYQQRCAAERAPSHNFAAEPAW